MNVYFLRHGPADWPNWTGSDDERPLTEEGRERVARIGKALAKLDLYLDAMVTSPLVRAKETAAIVARKLDVLDRLSEDERLAFGFNARGLAGILAGYVEKRAVMLVGHEPSMSAVIGDVAGGARLDFKKGSVACLDIPDPSEPRGTLLWFVPPKVLLA